MANVVGRWMKDLMLDVPPVNIQLMDSVKIIRNSLLERGLTLTEDDS